MSRYRSKDVTQGSHDLEAMFQEVQCTSRLHPGAERLLVLLQSTAHTWNRDLLLAASLSGVFQVRVGNSKLQGDPLKIELPLMCALLPAALPLSRLPSPPQHLPTPVQPEGPYISKTLL